MLKASNRRLSLLAHLKRETSPGAWKLEAKTSLATPMFIAADQPHHAARPSESQEGVPSSLNLDQA